MKIEPKLVLVIILITFPACNKKKGKDKTNTQGAQKAAYEQIDKDPIIEPIKDLLQEVTQDNNATSKDETGAPSYKQNPPKKVKSNPKHKKASKSGSEMRTRFLDKDHEKSQYRDCNTGALNLRHESFDTRIRYKQKQVKKKEGCIFEVQTAQCLDGVMTPFSGSYTFETCMVEEGIPVAAPKEVKITVDHNTPIIGATLTCIAVAPNNDLNPDTTYIYTWHNTSSTADGNIYQIVTADMGKSISCSAIAIKKNNVSSSLPVKSQPVKVKSLMEFPKVKNGITMANANALTVVGNYAFVANEDVEIIDLSNPQNITSIAKIDVHNVKGIAVSGNYAYIADWFMGVKIVDISVIQNPQLVGAIASFDDGAYHVAAAEGYLYVAAGNEGLKVFDISKPLSPIEIGVLNTDGITKEVQLNGTLAFLSDYTKGIKIVDISDRQKPQLIGRYDTEEDVHGISVHNDNLYLANDSNGLIILDIHSPHTPTQVGSFITDSYASDIKIVGNYAYLASWWEFYLIDIKDPQNPTPKVVIDKLGSLNVALFKGYLVTVSFSDSSYISNGGFNLIEIWK